MITLTKEEARRFMLKINGLYGAYAYSGKQGVFEYIHRIGCLQYDPVDACGRSPDLSLLAHVSDYRKAYLDELLYTDRVLFDYFDKNLSVMDMRDWPSFAHEREHFRQNIKSKDAVYAIAERLKQEISERGAVCSSDLDYEETVSWYWSDTRLARAALEAFYLSGDLAIHHKKGNIKFYDLAENCVPPEILNTPYPFATEFERIKWQVLRRIGAVGILWNRASDAFLGIRGMNADNRRMVFAELLNDGAITEIRVEGVKDALFCKTSDLVYLENTTETDGGLVRCEFLAPLECMLWDRKLIKALFGFEYKWEIYTPAAERKFGYYVLPILLGDSIIGRIEAIRDSKTKTLMVKNIWYETGTKPNRKQKSLIKKAIKRLARFNDCDNIVE